MPPPPRHESSRTQSLRARVAALPAELRQLVRAHGAALEVQARWRARVALRPGDAVRYGRHTWRVEAVEHAGDAVRAWCRAYRLMRAVPRAACAACAASAAPALPRAIVTTWVYDRTRVRREDTGERTPRPASL